LLVSSLAFAPAAFAQAPCSIQTITGTYAVQTTGWSASGRVIDSPLGPAYEVRGGEAVLVGQVTIAPDGTAAGNYWGVYVAFPIPVTPFTAQYRVKTDCTGETTDESGYVDKFVVLGNGKEIRAMGWLGFGTNLSHSYRITRADDPAPRCGQHTLRGTYMESCEGFAFTGELDPDGMPLLATANSLMVWTARDGGLTGTYRGKYFGFPDTLIESPLSGTYTVREDCTVDLDLALGVMPGFTIKARSVFFDQGKQGRGLPLGIYSGDTMVAPMGPLTCQVTRIGQ
jgi:hypothetical protein